MAKTRKNHEGKPDSGNLTPTSVDGGNNQRAKTPDTRHLPVKRPPITKRYMTRHSKSVPQDHTPAANRECSHNKVLVVGLASSRSVTISGRSWTAMRGVECPKISEIAAEEEDTNNNSTSEIPRTNIPYDDVQYTPPRVLSAPVVNHLPSENAHEGFNVIGTREVVGRVGSPTRSIGITEMAAVAKDDASNPDEVNSSIYPSLVTVKGYRVMKEFAPKLNEIITKYGDIAHRCPLKGKTILSTALEKVCRIMYQLEASRFEEITTVELQSILDEIDDLTTLGLDVKWLQERVEMISNAVNLFHGAATLKEEKTKNREEMVQKETSIAVLEQKLASEKKELDGIKAECEKLNERASEMKSAVTCFYRKSLVSGLL